MSTGYTLPSRSSLLTSDIWALWHSALCTSARMPEIKDVG